MKEVFVSDLLRQHISAATVELNCWISARRHQGKVVFIDACDSTGKIQIVASEDILGADNFQLAKKLQTESAITVKGVISFTGKQREITASHIALVGDVFKNFSPHPRQEINIFDEALTGHLLTNRHMYLRNPKVMAILRFRDCLLHHTREWFRRNRFMSIDAPILTPVPLYEDASAIPIVVHDEKVFLTQCVGYYLEAAVIAFERVFNIGPSFRGEEGRSKRHLMEYWHIKAEIAWANLDDVILVVENLISYISETCLKEMQEELSVLGTKPCFDGLGGPYPRISYEEAVKVLDEGGMKTEFGKSMGSDEEAELSKLFPGRPFWITGIPKTIEPFPYVVDKDDPRVTRVADLIASNGYGELLGTAEKICDLAMLDERMEAKGKGGDVRFEFIRDTHKVGCVPHAAFGMGVERMIRWMLNIPHVRDAIAFPRIFRRRIAP
jgi:asparaginyl-tRNA synthetase